MKFFFKILCLIAITTAAALAQSYNFKIIKTYTDQYPKLVSAVSVYDNSDEPCMDLKPGNFNIYIDSKKVDSLSTQFFQKSDKGMYFMLCVDLSATMKGQPLQTVKNSILRFIDNLRGIDKIGIMGFSDEAFLVSDFSSDKEYLKQKIRSLNTSGNNTSLYYGIYKGLEKLSDVKTEDGKMLIVMGDGKNENNAKSYSEEDVINKAKDEQIPIYSIGYSKISRIYLQTFEKISDKTSGTFYNSPSDEQLNKNFSKLYNQVLNMYLISYDVMNIEGDGKKHVNTITIKYNNETKSKSNEITFPAGIAALNGSNGAATKINWLLYGGIGGVLLIGLGVLFFVLNNKKKKEALERQRIEAERKRVDEEEMRRRREFQNIKQQEDYRNKQKNAPPAQDVNDLLAKAAQNVDSDKTMIINTAQQKNISSVILKVEVGPYSGNNFQINKEGANIGRMEGNTIVFKDNNVSKHHARIIFSNGKFYIEDLQSTNGTYINATKVANSVLNNGDTFKIGASEGRIQVL
ncbi:MAG: VWA domain-containing protein [Bacteroidota bacterium]|nr:VWA domain-containing protein [Bacteroidota bacterium]